MKKFFYISLTLFFCFSKISAAPTLPFCSAHESEIWKIRGDAGESIYQAHLQGGRLFRPSFAFTPREAGPQFCSMEKYLYPVFRSFFRFHELLSVGRATCSSFWKGQI